MTQENDNIVNFHDDGHDELMIPHQVELGFNKEEKFLTIIFSSEDGAKLGFILQPSDVEHIIKDFDRIKRLAGLQEEKP